MQVPIIDLMPLYAPLDVFSSHVQQSARSRCCHPLGAHFVVPLLFFCFYLFLLWPFFPPLLFPFGSFACRFLFISCSSTSHVGSHTVSDSRLNTCTFIPCAVIQFISRPMNWSTEYHMCSAFPCYHLSKLHTAIRHDLPPPSVGIFQRWQVIFRHLQEEAIDPVWVVTITLPASNHIS